MYSRAHLLIERDYRTLLEDDLWGIEAHPLQNDSVFTWTAKVQGLKESLWEGGIFRLYLKFNEHYKYRPPLVFFHTIPFHPNIDPITGRPCLDFLDDPSEWHESISVSYILAAVQNLLSNPVLTNAVNTDAAEMMIHNLNAYKQMVLDCVLASQRVEAGVDPRQVVLPPRYANDATHPPPTTCVDHPTTTTALNNSHRNNKTIRNLSFHDYYRTWIGIATSKPMSVKINPVIDLMWVNPSAERQRYVPAAGEGAQDPARHLESHNALVYGKLNNARQDRKNLEQEAKLAKIDKMRKIYLPPKHDQDTPTNSGSPGKFMTENETDLFGREADDILAWTSKLDANQL